LTEVIANALSSVAGEMQWTLFRTGYSTVIRESEDASSSILDRNGTLITFRGTLPYHMGVYETASASLLARYPEETLGEGDAFIVNHAYESGCPHLSDFCVLVPYFRNGKLAGFCGNTAHKPDIGGSVPGSGSGSATELFQEGTIVPVTRFFRRGERIDEVYYMLRANSRAPDLLVGDLEAQVGTASMGCRRLDEVMDRFGTETVLNAYPQLFSLTEAKVRREIASWPDGVAEGERFVDSDGIDLDKPVRIHVRIEKQRDRLLFDFTATADQTKGPANIRPTVVKAACSYCVTVLVDPALAINHGLARVIELKLREGSALHPFFPAPVNTYNPTVHALVEALFEAFGQITPHKKVADGCSSRSIIVGGRSNKTGKSYVQYEIFGGGSGGRSGKDGVSGTNVNQSNAKIAPIEIIESEFSARLRRFELIPDSGGPGRFRGGLGFVREYEILDHEARFSLRSTKHSVAPKGIEGGLCGRTGRCTLNPDTDKERVLPSRYSDHTLYPGDVVRLETPGGGGLGNPLERDPQKVLSDVLSGYVSQEMAEKTYGVVIERYNGELRIDEARTTESRSRGQASPAEGNKK
ncbi:MAG: hydantoinase B/oxoprolinase family protein, partial [Deltaproteobacteria bacterium]|nr:hydantoinase B/oxoprolinase family protein [Deltaproteobacteria bacterium]